MNYLPAIYHDIILEFLKNKKLAAIFLMYFVTVALLSVQITHAYFTDSATSTNNTFTAAEFFPTPTPIPGIANHIVISEVQIATAEASTSDFIELYNPTSSSIALTGHRLVKRTGSSSDTGIKVFDSSDIIPAKGFYLWASSDGGYSDQIGANVSTAENITANNSIALRNGPENSGPIIDAVGWGTPTDITPLTESPAFSTNPPDGQSIERKALSSSDATSMSGVDVGKGNGYDTNNNSTDFILRPTSQPQNSSSLTETP